MGQERHLLLHCLAATLVKEEEKGKEKSATGTKGDDGVHSGFLHGPVLCNGKKGTAEDDAFNLVGRCNGLRKKKKREPARLSEPGRRKLGGAGLLVKVRRGGFDTYPFALVEM